MNIFQLRDLLEHQEIYDIPLRCATYSRVSTEKETQAASLVNMTDDFREFVEAQKNWTFVKAFIDDGKSGLTTKKREDFLKLLAAGASGEYDLLVTGEISRFGRNTLEGLQNIQYLKDKGIPVIFLYDDLNTYDSECDTLIQQKLVDAELESRKISKRVKRGHQKSIRKGHVLGCRMWGYKKVDCKLVIDEETAPMVRMIFELYATNQYSMKDIEQIIYDKGYRNTNGNKLAHTTMANIIQNPKYKGFFAGGKVKVVDIFSKRQKYIPEEDWVMYKDESGDVVPALVSEELWEKANEVFRRRSIDVKSRRNCSTHKNTYTGKLFCAVDGAPYYCKDVHYKGTDISKWLCSHKIKYGAASCPSVALYEDELSAIILDMFVDFESRADQLLDRYSNIYRECISDGAHDKAERERLTQALLAVDKKKENLMDLKLSGDVNLDEFRFMMERLRTQAEEINRDLEALNTKDAIADGIEVQIQQLKESLRHGAESVKQNVVSRDFVDNYIRKILVTPIEENILQIDIQILTDEVFYYSFEKFKGRTGHMSKKMIEAYENSMK